MYLSLQVLSLVLKRESGVLALAVAWPSTVVSHLCFLSPFAPALAHLQAAGGVTNVQPCAACMIGILWSLMFWQVLWMLWPKGWRAS